MVMIFYCDFLDYCDFKGFDRGGVVIFKYDEKRFFNWL